MPEPSRERSDVLLYGEARPARNVLRRNAGLLSFVFEDGTLKHLRLGQVEIARRVYFAVRDAAWRTVPSKISNIQVEPQSGSFKVCWTGQCLSADVDYEWQGNIEIASSGLIHFRARGKALKTFTTPRIGICLLLSTTATMDRAFEVTYVDGQTKQLRFDRIFKRTQLACRWTSLKFSPEAGVEIQYRIEGSYFDLEDQRNFGDTSCKAMAGMPYRGQKAPAGEEHEQVLTIRVSAKERRIDSSHARDVVQLRARPGEIDGKLPQVGVSLGNLEAGLASSVVPLVAALKGVLHCWVDAPSPKLKAQGELAKSIALQTGQPIYLTVKNLGDETVPHMVSMLKQWAASGVVVQQMAILDNTHPGLTLLRACAREAGLSIPCGKTVASFKDRAGLLEGANSGADFLAWQGTPLSHQEDDETLLENADVFPHQTATARGFAPQARVTIGPMRLDRSQPDTYLLPDPRHRGLLAAAFVASSLRALAQARVDLAVFFDAVGPAGHMDVLSWPPPTDIDGNPRPHAFPSYYVLREFGPLAGSETFEVECSDALRVKAFGVRHPAGAIVVVINQTPEAQRASLSGIYEKGSVVRIRSLDEATFPTLATRPASSLLEFPERRQTVEADGLDLAMPAFSVAILMGSR